MRFRTFASQAASPQSLQYRRRLLTRPLAGLLAYGASLPVGQLILVVTGAGFISSLVPVPGGIGVAEASLIAGLTAFGVPPDAASAAVVTYRLFTTYLPPIPGSYATKWLVANGDL